MSTGTPRPQRILSRKMFDALIEAGIIRTGDYVRRVVIDIEINQAVVMHVERYGDERLLSLVPRLEIADEENGMSEHGDAPAKVPATEARGGENPDWENARPGEPLREKPDLGQPGEDKDAS